MASGPKIVLRIKTAMGDVVDETREVDDFTVALPDAWHTWYLDSDQMAEDSRNGKLVQTVTQKSNRPVQVFDNLPTVTPRDINQLASETYDSVKAKIDYYKQKNSLLLWFAIFALLILLIISIVILMNI